MGVRFEHERLDNRLVAGFRSPLKNESILVFFEPTGTGLRVVAPFLTGRQGTSDAAAVARVAHLAYQLDLALGVDPRDGEVRAWQKIELAAVEWDLRVGLVVREVRGFLSRLAAAVQGLAGQWAAPTDVVSFDLAEQEDLRPCD